MKRVQWIDVLKYICIMLVILSHLESVTPALGLIYGPIYVTGFFFAAGYTFKLKDSFRLFISKKVKALLVPWLFFSVTNILVAHVLSFNEHSSIVDELMWNFLQIREKGDGIWFVAALFMCFIPFYFWTSLYERNIDYNGRKVVLVLMALSLYIISHMYSTFVNPNIFYWKSTALPWHLEYIFIGMFWMVLGYVFNREFEKNFDRLPSITCSISGILYVLVRCFGYWGGIITEASVVVNLCWSFLSSILGIVSLIYICKHIRGYKYILYIGQNTLICFALHGKVYSIIQFMLKRYIQYIYDYMLNNVLYSSVLAIIITLVVSVVLIIPIYVINRWIPFVVGKAYKKTK